MTRAAFIAGQKTGCGVPYAVACRALGVSESWFFKWRGRPPAPARQRRSGLDKAVAEMSAASKGAYGSPRIHRDLQEAGWQVSEKTVAKSMARQGLAGRPVKRRRGLTKPDKGTKRFPDLVNRGFTAPALNLKWCGDITEVPAGEGKLCLASVIDLFSRRLLGYATSAHPDARLAGGTIKMAVAVRGGNVAGVIFRTDRGSAYTAGEFTGLRGRLGITRSMGRVGPCFGNAAAGPFFPALGWEVLSRHDFTARAEATNGLAH